ncbi:MAG: hypothetical protein GQ570_07495 [Helicobacteraceae bacterium]|nr:hypothetical protein [Helicobacteraceae bacterium]
MHLLAMIFLLLLTMQLISGVLLFSLNVGVLPSEIASYYLGSEYTPAKSMETLVKVTLPHLLGFGFVLMGVMHLYFFIDEVTQTKKIVLLFIIVVSAVIDLLSPYLILLFGSSFAMLKLFGFVSFELIITYILYVSIRSIIKKSLNKLKVKN